MNANSKISTAARHGCDPAELGQLTATVERLLPAIEKFWRYDGRDDAAGRRQSCGPDEGPERSAKTCRSQTA